MLAWLAKLGLGEIFGQIEAAYHDYLTAETNDAKIAADAKIKALEAQRDVLVAEAASRINGLVRMAFALPVVAYFGKLILWDKVLGLGTTDNLSPMLWDYALTVVGFYFVNDMVARWKA